MKIAPIAVFSFCCQMLKNAVEMIQKVVKSGFMEHRCSRSVPLKLRMDLKIQIQQYSVSEQVCC